MNAVVGERAGARPGVRPWFSPAWLPRLFPWADAASDTLPWSRILRLSLFQVSVGLALVMLNGTLNRVMIVELGVPAWLVGTMVALPLLFAPLRALVGFRSDHHRSAIGWKRVPYLWAGTLLTFGGFAIMPFALLLLTGDGNASVWTARAAAGLSFLLVGAGMHTVQTAGLALATDLAPPERRPQVIAVLYVALLVGMLVSALALGALLADYRHLRLIQVVQGAAVVSIVLNVVALWRQEALSPAMPSEAPRPKFGEAWRRFAEGTRARRFLVAVTLGTLAFGMQDILLEPYGGEILGLSVGATTGLTAVLAAGGLVAFALAATVLARGTHPVRLAATGALAGVAAFSAVVFADPLQSTALFAAGTFGIGFGAGLFAVGTLTVAMGLGGENDAGLSLGAWGAAQATAAGVGIALGATLRDVVGALATSGALGDALATPATGYSVVYHLEIFLLFATLVALGPLVSSPRPSHAPSPGLSHDPSRPAPEPARFGLADFPT